MSPIYILQLIHFVQQFLFAILMPLDGKHINRLIHSEHLQDKAFKQSNLAISVKTTRKYHYTRLIDILDTWYEDAPTNTFFVTDEEDPELSTRLNGRLIVTNCTRGHNHRALNCKLQWELELLAKINANWSCHFDDDNYVNIPRLLQVLAKFDSSHAYYIGRPTTEEPVQVDGKRFWFATGGAGICLSKPLINQIRPYIQRFNQLTPGFEGPDDVTLGYLITGILQVPLTVEPSFHSHLHKLETKHLTNLHKQAILGPANSILWHLNPMGSKDRQLFYALHCHNFEHKCLRVGIKLLRR